MPDQKSCTTKCYCNKNSFKRGLMEKSDSTTSRSSKSQFEFIKLKRDYDVLSTSEKSGSSHEGHHINFSRRSSTSTVNSLATPSSCSAGSCSSNSHQNNQKNEQPAKAIRVNKLEYSDQRTLYEQIRLVGDQHDGNLTPEIRTTKIYLFDPAYLKELQEFRLNNRAECFGS